MINAIILRLKVIAIRLIAFFTMDKSQRAEVEAKLEEVKKHYDPTVYMPDGKPYTTTTRYWSRKGTQPKGMRPQKKLIQKIQYYIWRQNNQGLMVKAPGNTKTITHAIKGI